MLLTTKYLKKVFSSVDLSDQNYYSLFNELSDYIINYYNIGSKSIHKKIDIKYEKLLLSLNDYRLSYLFAKEVLGADIYAHQDVIIRCGNLDYMCKFAQDVKGADIDKLQSIIIKSGSLKHIFEFAISVSGADVDKLRSIIINSNDVEYNYKFARAISNGFKPDTDIINHEKIVIDSGSAHYNYCFARDVKGADIKAHGEAVISSKNGEYNYYFAKMINGSDVRRHIDALIASCNPEFVYRFLKYRDKWIKIEPNLEDITIKECEESIIRSGNAYYNYCFIKKIDGASIYAHAVPIIKSGSAKYNYLFANEIKKSNFDNDCMINEIINACSQVVIDSGSFRYNYLFAKCIKNVDTYAHIESALKNMRHDAFAISIDMDGNVKKAKTKTKKLR